MKLYLNATSPYARIIRIVLIEKGLMAQTELIWCDPWNDDPELISQNPMAKIPVFVTKQGKIISETLLIAQYLEDLQPSRSPLVSKNYEETLHLTGLSIGLIDAAFTSTISRKFLDDAANHSTVSERREKAIKRTLAHLNTTPFNLNEDEVSLGAICLGVALEYICFRLSEVDLPHTYSNLDIWRQQITQRSSFKETQF